MRIPIYITCCVLVDPLCTTPKLNTVTLLHSSSCLIITAQKLDVALKIMNTCKILGTTYMYTYISNDDVIWIPNELENNIH